jgi:hypothetical protein
LNFLITKEKERVERKLSHLRKNTGISYEEIVNHDELNQVISQGN